MSMNAEFSPKTQSCSTTQLDTCSTTQLDTLPTNQISLHWQMQQPLWQTRPQPRSRTSSMNISVHTWHELRITAIRR